MTRLAVQNLRKKFRAVDPEFKAIETLYGVGYRFDEEERVLCMTAQCG